MSEHAITARTAVPLLASTLAFTVFSIAYVALNAGMPHPDAAPAEVLAYGLAHPGLLEAGSALMLLAAAPLAVTGALAYIPLRERLGRVPAIAPAGGLLAAGALTSSAVFGWVSAQFDTDTAPSVARVIADLGFAFGGPAYATAFGLLVAGIAIPALLGRLLPRWLAALGLVIAVAGAVAAIGLAVPGAQVLIPVVRFGGLLWLVGSVIVLTRRTSTTTR
ncbi:DUF4386 domain-containing protein [Nocardia bovistercoris]|uniref:DUF4386 domain-containing protein n=1 Tax=Nocardia bovistercoris TaxID=2785916 RepID=A0A931IC55_9NOCA|nr:DUF4386 domain-containing protein [Nocardia bovistercoris]MBH0777841.1 DUF4386 domain-containing protein [Nocardia bovistercoris]